MGLQDIVCARCPRGGGVHRERQAAAGYRFSMVLAGSTSIVAAFFLLDAFGSSVLLAASLVAACVAWPSSRAQQHMSEQLSPPCSIFQVLMVSDPSCFVSPARIWADAGSQNIAA